jgi:hypothetical protein
VDDAVHLRTAAERVRVLHFVAETVALGNLGRTPVTAFNKLYFLCNLQMGDNKLECSLSILVSLNTSLLGPFISYEVLKIWPMVPYTKHVVLFVTYKLATIR